MDSGNNKQAAFISSRLSHIDNTQALRKVYMSVVSGNRGQAETAEQYQSSVQCATNERTGRQHRPNSSTVRNVAQQCGTEIQSDKYEGSSNSLAH